MQRRELVRDFIGLIEANERPNLVEEALRYRALTELSELSTDDLIALAAHKASAAAPTHAKAPISIAWSEPRSFAS